jgi:lysophospholipase
MGGHVVLRTLADRHPAIDAAVLVAPMLAINSAPMPAFAAEWLASFFSACSAGAVSRPGAADTGLAAPVQSHRLPRPL